MSERLEAIAESQYIDGRPPHWLDQLRQASFRGVPFHVDTIEWTAGDNAVVREYPFQDLPTVFRMGAAVQEIKFSAYVIGDDYHLQRDALASALTGEGLLMHPTAGAMRVYVAGKFAVREAPTAEGGMARFDLHFVRADARRYPTGTTATRTTAASQAAAAKQASAAGFAAQWQPKGQPGWVAERAVERVRTSLAGVLGPLQAAARNINGWNAEITSAYQTVITGLDGLLASPRQLADAVVEIFRLPSDLSSAAAQDFAAAFQWAFDLDSKLPRKPFESRIVPAPGAGLVMYGTGTLDARADTPAQRVVTDLTTASDRLIESCAVAAYVEAAATIELQSYDEAAALRAEIHAQVLRLLQEASAAAAPASVPAESWHDAMLVMHTAALADLHERSRDLVRLTTYTPDSWQPVWAISYRLFGTAAYADEILAMNPHIEHPLLVPPGQPLRVMAR